MDELIRPAVWRALPSVDPYGQPLILCVVALIATGRSSPMYHSSVLQRSAGDEEDRSGRDNMTTQHLPPYTTRSPTQSHYKSYSPTDGSHSQFGYNIQYHSQAAPPAALPPPSRLNGSPPHRPLSSPTTHHLPPINGSSYNSRDSGPSTFYDPTSDQGDRNDGWIRSNQSVNQSPVQVSHQH